MVKQGVLGPEATNGNISGKALQKTVSEVRVIRCRNQPPQQPVRALSEVFEDGISKGQRRCGYDPSEEEGSDLNQAVWRPSPGMLPSLIPPHPPWLHGPGAETCTQRAADPKAPTWTRATHPKSFPGTHLPLPVLSSSLSPMFLHSFPHPMTEENKGRWSHMLTFLIQDKMPYKIFQPAHHCVTWQSSINS